MTAVKHLTCLFILLCLSACETVQPWERGTLARREMQWEPDRMESSLQAQINLFRRAGRCWWRLRV